MSSIGDDPATLSICLTRNSTGDLSVYLWTHNQWVHITFNKYLQFTLKFPDFNFIVVCHYGFSVYLKFLCNSISFILIFLLHSGKNHAKIKNIHLYFWNIHFILLWVFLILFSCAFCSFQKQICFMPMDQVLYLPYLKFLGRFLISLIISNFNNLFQFISSLNSFFFTMLMP